MALGTITILDTLKWSESSGSQVAVEVRDGIIAVIFQTWDADFIVKCATFSYDGSGNLVKLDEGTLTGMAVTATIIYGIIKIADGILAFTDNDGYVCTVAIAANGTITTAILDELQFRADANCSEPFICHGTGDMWVISYYDPVGDDSYITTVEIDSSGAIAAAVAVTQQISIGFSNNINSIKIADGKIAIFFADGNDNLAHVETRTISGIGAISAIIDSSTWSDESQYDLRPFHITGTIYACSYRDGTDGGGWINTFNIAADGTITTVDIDSFNYEPAAGGVPGRWATGGYGSGVAIVFYPDVNDYAQAKTVDIDGSGNIGASVLDTETVDNVFADYTHLIKVSETMYIVIWSDDDVYGQAASLSVSLVAGFSYSQVHII